MRRILLPLATSALLLAACSSGDDTADSATHAQEGGGDQAAAADAGEHNEADVTFANQMILHHEDAVAMAELAATRAERPEVTELASAIISTQNAEIEQMRAWLEAWGEQSPDSGQDGGHEGMTGMMAPEQMEQMEAASGAAFDQLFIEHMITHHEAAIPMADTVLAKGSNPQVKQLAEAIRTTQQAEIDQMRTWP